MYQATYQGIKEALWHNVRELFQQDATDEAVRRAYQLCEPFSDFGMDAEPSALTEIAAALRAMAERSKAKVKVSSLSALADLLKFQAEKQNRAA